MRTRVELIAALAMLAALTTLNSALAQTPAATAAQSADETEEPTRARAKMLFQQGVDAYERGRFKDAVDFLLEADQLMPNPAFAYNIALAYGAMGDTAAALKWYRHYLRQSPNAADRMTLEGKINELESELQKKGVQQVTVLSEPLGATVAIDGRPAGVTPYTVEIVPGRHRIALQLAGYRSEVRDIELRSDRAIDVVVELAAQPASDQEEAEPAPPPKPEPPAEPRKSPQISPWSYAVMGAGLAAVGGAVLFEIQRSNAEDEAQAATQAEYQTLFDEMKEDQRNARVLLGVGGALIAVGVFKLLLDLNQNGTQETSVAAACTTTGCGVFAGAAFQ